MIKNPFCRPRLRSAAGKPGSPMSLLDRIREAVFRLIMFSALSKGGATKHTGRSSAQEPSDFGYYPNDPHHSEAVAECIEFLKKSAAATAEDGHRDSAAGDYADAQTTLPVM